MKPHLAMVAVTSILLSACVSSVGRPPIPVPEVMPYSQRDSYLDVYADPYLQFVRQWDYFGTDLREWRVIAIQVLVQNKSDLSFTLQFTDTWLDLPDGTKILRTEAGGFYWTKAWSEFGSIFGGWRYDYEKGIDRFRVNELGKVVLNKDQSVHGFVYFVIPNYVDLRDIRSLVFRFMEEKEENTTVIRLSLNRLSYSYS